MKKLISLNEIHETFSLGEKVVYLDGDSLVTPAARDAAAEFGMKLVEDTAPTETQSHGKTDSPPLGVEVGCMDIALITRLVMEALLGKSQENGLGFERECDAGGLRLIRGSTVKCEPFETGNPRAVVGIKDIVNTRESPHVGAGFMTIEKSSFEWKLDYEEFDVILEGTLDVTINDRKYSGKTGDVFFIPKGSRITWSSPDRARFFYVTYPKLS